MSSWKRTLLISTLAAALLAPHAAARRPVPHDLPPTLQAALDEPLKALPADPTPKAFRVVALSHLAEACAGLHAAGRMPQEEALACAERAADIALDGRLVSPYSRSPAQVKDLGDEGLYLSHLTVILATAQLLGSEAHRELTLRLAWTLHQRSLAEPTHILPSYGVIDARWPADQAVTLHALWLVDQSNNSTFHIDPLAGYLEVMAEQEDPALGLPLSELTGVTGSGHLPRGCAMSWTVRYLAGVAPGEARALWQSYRDQYLVRVGPASGLREWPPGVSGPMDMDSGPIIAGVGAAATGLGLGAAKAMGDHSTYGQLSVTQGMVGGAAELERGQVYRLAHGALAEAIALHATVADVRLEALRRGAGG